MLQIDTSERAAAFWRLLLLRGGIAILLGIVLLIWPHTSLRLLLVIFSSYLFVDGLIGLVSAVRNANAGKAWKRRAFEATVAIVSAVVVWLWPHVVLGILGYLIGLVLVARGIVQIFSISSSEAARPVRPWLAAAAIMSLVGGTIFLFSPRNGLTLFVWTLAIYGFVFGATLIALAFHLKQIADTAEKTA